MTAAAGVFVLASAAILIVGPRMARVADRLAELTGFGGALFGLVFLALATDLPELALTPTAVLGGTPKIAVGSLLGSAAAQLVLLAVVDMVFRRGKLYGRVPLQSTLGQCALMLAVLAVPLVVATGTPAVGGVSLSTFLLPAAYLGVLAAIRGVDGDEASADSDHGPPPVDDASEADRSVDSGHGKGEARSLWLRFAMFAVVLAGAGVVLESATETIGSTVGLGETAAGALLAGVATSLPELVTAVAAARSGALDLAVGDVVGSSAFDVALLSWADVFHTEGSVFDLLGRGEFTLIGVALALTSLLVAGLARRKPVGASGVGVESYLMLAVYAGGALVLISAGA